MRVSASIGLVVLGLWTPSRIVLAQVLEFEVASVKRNTTNGPVDGTPHRSGDRVTMHNTQPYSMIYYAYHLTGDYQMVNYARLPEGWNWYDVDARLGSSASEDQIRLMFQSLLADRFRLKVHREMRTMPEFEFVIDKGESKMKAARTDGPLNLSVEGRQFALPYGSCGVSGWIDGARLICHGATMGQVAAAVGRQLHAPVTDHTGLSAAYDLDVLFAPENLQAEPDTESAPPLTEALKQELGLRLIRMKGQVEVLVIDHMETPSAN
jgi:uncharacterized protein (TIGR03435 family)